MNNIAENDDTDVGGDAFKGQDGKTPISPNTLRHLSEVRAQAVCNAVVLAADRDRSLGLSGAELRKFMFPVGLGGQRLKVKDVHAAESYVNRRVEIHMLS